MKCVVCGKETGSKRKTCSEKCLKSIQRQSGIIGRGVAIDRKIGNSNPIKEPNFDEDGE